MPQISKYGLSGKKHFTTGSKKKFRLCNMKKKKAIGIGPFSAATLIIAKNNGNNPKTNNRGLIK